MFISLARKSAPFPELLNKGDTVEINIKYYRYGAWKKPFYIRILYICFCVFCGLIAINYFHEPYGQMLAMFVYAASALVFWIGYIIGYWITRLADTWFSSTLRSLQVTFTKDTIRIHGGHGVIQSLFGRTVPVAGVATFQAVNASDVDNTLDPRNHFAPEMAVIMISVTGAPMVLCINSMSMAQNAAIVSPLNDTLAHIKRGMR